MIRGKIKQCYPPPCVVVIVVAGHPGGALCAACPVCCPLGSGSPCVHQSVDLRQNLICLFLYQIPGGSITHSSFHQHCYFYLTSLYIPSHYIFCWLDMTRSPHKHRTGALDAKWIAYQS